MGEVDEPVKPQEVGENYSSESVFACSSTEAGPLWLAGVVAIGLVYRRKTH
jgi:MYXO-CTERM domain-containing protein